MTCIATLLLRKNYESSNIDPHFFTYICACFLLINVLSEITLLDKIFKVFIEGLTLGCLVSLVVMKGAVVLRSGTSRVVLLCFRMLQPGLTLDVFKDILDRELQRGEAR